MLSLASTRQPNYFNTYLGSSLNEDKRYDAIQQTFEQRKLHQHRRNIYSAIIKSVLLLTSIPFVFAPFTIKKIAKLSQNAFFNNKPTAHKLFQTLSDKQKFTDLYWRITSILGLSALSYLQISFNTKQPSKFMSEALAIPLGIIGIFKPAQFIRSITFLCPVFWFTGERNDFENGNHLGKRREWDLKRLTNPKEWRSFVRFISKDLSYSFSLVPWKGIFNKKGATEAPNANHAALAAQFSLLSAISGIFMKSGRLKNTVTIVSGLAGALFSQIPVVTRAWQNRTEADGILALTGAPFMVIGKAFALLGSISYLSALVTIGSPMIVEGKRRNSVKYRNTLDYLALLQQESYQNRNVRAEGLLAYFKLHPESLQYLRRLIGKSRLQFILGHLKQASKYNMPLWQYLAPIMQIQTSDETST